MKGNLITFGVISYFSQKINILTAWYKQIYNKQGIYPKCLHRTNCITKLTWNLHLCFHCRSFLTLTPDVQNMLLSRNSDLFIQLFLGFYLGCSSGVEQLQIVQTFLSLPVSPKVHSFPRFLTLHQFIAVSNLFKANEDFNLYHRLILRLKNVCLTNVTELALLASFILFDFGPQNLNSLSARY